MHGIIFTNLYKYIRETHGSEMLENIKEKANITRQFYDATKSHPDEEIQALMSAACQLLNVEIDELLEIFGAYIAPGLLKTYSAFVKEEWDCMDLLEHIENTIHRTVRMSIKESSPPVLNVKRIDKDHILIVYTSKRQMISLGIGIIKAIGAHYNEKLLIEKIKTPEGFDLKIARER